MWGSHLSPISTPEVHLSSQSAKGAGDCGDVDIMITKEGAESPYLRAVLDRLVGRLTKAGFLKCACEPVLPFLIATLTAIYSGNASRARRWIESKDHGHTITSLTNHNVPQWHGASQISPDLPWRRIGDSAHPVWSGVEHTLTWLQTSSLFHG